MRGKFWAGRRYFLAEWHIYGRYAWDLGRF